MNIPLSIKIATWNLEWAEAKQKRKPYIEELVHNSAPDVCCFTEALTEFIPHDEHIISADPDYGYPNTEGLRRKVVLTSSLPWENVDTHGASDLPPGRYISGVSHGIRFIGVCIPWHNAHVTTGRKDAKMWDEHRRYLVSLEHILNAYAAAPEPTCLLGDYNQRIPKGWQPEDVFELLCQSLRSLQLHTSDIQDPEGKLFIDHVATSPDLQYSINGQYPKKHNGTKLSDHSGHFGSLTNIVSQSSHTT